MPVTNYKWDGFGALFFKRRYFQGVQRWPKKCVLGCVISPLAAGAISRNLGQAFLAISVLCSTVYQVGMQNVAQETE